MTPREIEKLVREILKKRFNKKFALQKLVIGKKRNGQPHKHEFDCVSSSRTIVCEVKSNKFKTEAGYLTTIQWRIFSDCFFLSNVKAKKKIMVLTNRPMSKRFTKDWQGLFPSLTFTYVNLRTKSYEEI